MQIQIQGQKYDPDGEYVRTWIPELARMPTEWVHCPWDAPSSILGVAGVELGFNYPKPIVELNTARQCLDDAVSMMWQLDTTAKLAELNGEVVEDNMNYIKSSNIPVVVLKKELSSTVSSFDQTLLDVNGKNKLQSSEVKGLYTQIIQADVMNASNMEDTESTANLKVSRKRSHSDGAFSVPSCSSSFGMHSRIHDPESSSILYLEQKPDRNDADGVSILVRTSITHGNSYKLPNSSFRSGTQASHDPMLWAASWAL
jgi:cryptochrome 2